MSAEPQEIDLSRSLDGIRHLVAQREAQGLSIVDLERRSGVSMNTVYAWAKGTRDPWLSSFVALADGLGYEVIMRPRDRRA